MTTPTLFPTSNVKQHTHRFHHELRMATREECEYGCKWYGCRACYVEVLIHSASYGCPIGRNVQSLRENCRLDGTHGTLFCPCPSEFK